LISEGRRLLLAGALHHDEMCPSRSEYFGRLDRMRARSRTRVPSGRVIRFQFPAIHHRGEL